MRIAIASGKGGTGKTFVATNLFWSAQKAGRNVTLVDCDAEEPNDTEFISGFVLNNQQVVQNLPVIDLDKCTFCGKCFEYCNYNAIVFVPDRKFIQIIEPLCHDCGACTVACTFSAITEIKKNIGTVKHIYVSIPGDMYESCSNIGTHSPVKVIKKAISETNKETLSILDSPPGISCPFIVTTVNADYVILVTEPTPFGLNDLKLSVETLNEIGKPYGVIINRAGLGNNDVQQWLKNNNIHLLLEIPFDREIAKIYSEGGILAEKKSSYRNIFLNLLSNIENNILK